MSDFFGRIKSGAGKVAFEADKMTRLNRAKGDLEKIKNQIQAQYVKLGEMYYNQRATVGVTGPAYDEICQAIVGLEQQVESKNGDIQRISAEVYGPQGTQPTSQPVSTPMQYASTPAPLQSSPAQVLEPVAVTTKICSNCGKEMLAEVKFCPDCGTKV
jgi:membrane protease subunit (stomatin/prohibitin family)